MIINEEPVVVKARANGRTLVEDGDHPKGLQEDISCIIAEVEKLEARLNTIRRTVEELDIPCNVESENIYYKRLYGLKDVDIPCSGKDKDVYYKWMYGAEEEK